MTELEGCVYVCMCVLAVCVRVCPRGVYVCVCVCLVCVWVRPCVYVCVRCVCLVCVLNRSPRSPSIRIQRQGCGCWR
jgi:hypothetical protein